MRMSMRRPTIISPTIHIRSYSFGPFLALILTGCFLSFVAGYINTICIVSLLQSSITGFTGTTSKMETALKLKGTSIPLLLSTYLVSLACGLQNGMCTTFSGAVIRTTHMTGVLTDIGLVLGQALFCSRTRKHLWKLKVLIPLYGAFCLGGVSGWFAYKLLLFKAILLLSAIIGTLDLNTDGCPLEADEVCSLSLRIDYTNSNNSFALIGGSPEAVLVLTNGEPQVNEITFIWFNELRVQRMASILCFSVASCGLDLIKQIYREQFRPFDYKTIRNTLIDQLYSASTSSSSLTCADPSGSSIACSDGFCRSVFTGNGIMEYSTCVKKGLVSNPYGIIVTKATVADLIEEQISIIFTCNKPMCNSKENVKQVLQQLISAKLIPESMITTTMSNIGIKLLNNKQTLFVFFLFLFSIFKFLN
ncbi:unnamed protein product [Rotaria sp. Silwood1]|nr:unnamed protein product [Rotaria sp. Silwood1]CAF3447460.1 unnamed protein product [Rotaria sp. Silwood1]CAF3482113.1 unnamed protein product [Rotaria sp. Silwood1]CAF4540361.1 unnamed protein product [Rotaria sp. Silwood1]